MEKEKRSGKIKGRAKLLELIWEFIKVIYEK